MLLAIDTSTRTAGVALYNGVQVLAEMVWTSHDYHTVELAPLIQQALAQAGVQISALGAVGVATGPGSFTGLRIGLAVAKGLALGNHLTLIGVPSLDVLAAAQPMEDLPMAAALRAGRGRLAVGWYHVDGGSWVGEGKYRIMDVQALSGLIQQPTVVCGELTEAERRILARKRKNVHLASPARSLRRPSFLAELAWKRWRAGQNDDPVTLSPIYVHIGDPIPG